MSTEQNKALVRSFYELMDKGDLAAIVGLCSADLAYRFTGQPAPLTRETLRGLIQGFRTAFPNMQHALDSQVAEGDWVVTPLIFRGAHTGDLMGIPPTGKRVEVRAIGLHRVSGGKIVRGESVVDIMALMQQIGAAASPR